MKTKTTITVECELCGAVFRVEVGWIPYDPRRHARYGKRATIRAAYEPTGVTLAGSISEDAMEMRVPIRARECGDHAKGTEGCRGSLRRADRAPTRPGTPAPPENGP